MASKNPNEATTNLVQNLGILRTWKKNQNGIEGVTPTCKFHVLVHNDKTIRVRITKNPQFDEFPYTVVEDPFSVTSQVKEHKKSISIKTKNLEVVVQKNPVRFNFYTKKGELISEDDPGLGSSWMGNEITTYRSLQEGERFIGLGEKTGNLDRRGSGFIKWQSCCF